MFLHLPALFERQRPWFLEQARWETDFADVVHKPTKVGVLLRFFRKVHSLGNVARVDSHCGGVPGGVLVPRVERRDQSGGELQICSFERCVRVRQIVGQPALVLIQRLEPLSGHGGHKE